MSTVIKRMIIGLVLVMGIAILFSSFAQAQPMRMSTEDRVKMLKDSLTLNDEQAAKITVILDQQSEQMSAAFEKYSDNRDSMRAAMQEIRGKSDKKITTILTKDQATKYDVMQKERLARMGQRPQ
jgi:Spy/CpxP family protein refolding chaperone